MTEKTTEKAKTVLRPNRSKHALHVRNVFHVEPQIDDTKEDLLRREYWLHMSPKPKPGDKIEALWEGGSKYAEMIVLDADSKGVSVAFVIDILKLGEALPREASEAFSVAWAGPHHKYRVSRESDGEIMKTGFDSEGEANRYIIQTLKAA